MQTNDRYSCPSTQVATQLRVVSYVSFAIMLTMLYYDVGNNATRVISNAALFLLCLTIALFQSAMPTVLICEPVGPSSRSLTL